MAESGELDAWTGLGVKYVACRPRRRDAWLAEALDGRIRSRLVDGSSRRGGMDGRLQQVVHLSLVEVQQAGKELDQLAP